MSVCVSAWTLYGLRCVEEGGGRVWWLWICLLEHANYFLCIFFCFACYFHVSIYASTKQFVNGKINRKYSMILPNWTRRQERQRGEERAFRKKFRFNSILCHPLLKEQLFIMFNTHLFFAIITNKTIFFLLLCSRLPRISIRDTVFFSFTWSMCRKKARFFNGTNRKRPRKVGKCRFSVRFDFFPSYYSMEFQHLQNENSQGSQYKRPVAEGKISISVCLVEDVTPFYRANWLDLAGNLIQLHNPDELTINIFYILLIWCRRFWMSPFMRVLSVYLVWKIHGKCMILTSTYMVFVSISTTVLLRSKPPFVKKG